MATKKTTTKTTAKTTGKAPPVKASKSGAATKKTTLRAIEGGKSGPMLRDGRTPANADSLRRALEIYGIVVAPDARTEDMLSSVRKHLGSVLGNLADEDKISCEAVCGEVSTNDTDFCPYCGDEGLGDGNDEAAEAEALESITADDPVGSNENESPEVATNALTAGAEVELADENFVAPWEAEPDVAPKAKKGAKGKGAKAETGDLAKVDPGAIDRASELEDAIGRINGLKGDLASNSYDLGLELRSIQESELWKSKGHESFKSFIEREIEISRAMAYRLIEITKEFDRTTFKAVGSRKLALIAGIQDAEEREAALEAAKAGASTNEVQRQVDESKGRTPAPPREKGEREKPAPAKSGAEITLLTKVGAKPLLVGFRSAASGRPINHHKDDAYAELQIAEDVKLRMAPKLDRDGNMVGLTVAFVRVV
jgi:hypothetical protein